MLMRLQFITGKVEVCFFGGSGGTEHTVWDDFTEPENISLLNICVKMVIAFT